MNEFDEDKIQDAINEALRTLLKNGHVSSGLNENGEIVFWCSDEDWAKYNQEKHIYGL